MSINASVYKVKGMQSLQKAFSRNALPVSVNAGPSYSKVRRGLDVRQGVGFWCCIFIALNGTLIVTVLINHLNTAIAFSFAWKMNGTSTK